MKPKKLIRNLIINKLKTGEFEELSDINEINKLYALKIKEELIEIQNSDHKDILEFVDLMQVAIDFAITNGFSSEELHNALELKALNKGVFGKLVLNNLNPDNVSNKIYFN